MTPSRREFFRRVSFVVLPNALFAGRTQDPPKAVTPLPASGTVGDTLATAVGRPSSPLGPLDNDPEVIAIERRLRCTCGCTLDVYTCRTTDFACTYSPAMHQDVVSQVQRGETPQQILDWFVAQPGNGEKVLMSPPARGFNLAGYLLPGIGVAAFGLALAAWLMRHREAAPGPTAVPAAPPEANADQLDRLRRALDDVES